MLRRLWKIWWWGQWFAFTVQPAKPTTVVVAVTPSAIVVGADSKTINPNGTAVKIFLLKKRLALADIYAESAKSKDGSITFYDFPTWVKEIDKNTDSKISVTALAATISEQMPHTFSFIIDAIKSGKFTRDQARSENVGGDIVEYVIAGYENGVPVVQSIRLTPDWDANTVRRPLNVPLKEEKGQRADSHILWRGQGVTLERLRVADSNEQNEFAARVPVEFTILRGGKDLTANQASNVVRAMLGLESKANPRYVSFPITIVTIPRTGTGRLVTYERDITPLSGSLASGKGRKDEQN